MKTNLLFDFTVDKATSTVAVNREFSAKLPVVWDAFTRQEILDQWWAPKPWLSKTKHMHFEVGGRRFYAMCGPEGEEHWAIQDFVEISPKTNFKFVDAFADKDENINADFPAADWNLDFSESNGITSVKITIKLKTLSALEQMLEMGFKEGFTMTLDYLAELLHKSNIEKVS
jgi:uncharacterized protein YndB with AHSA1/START domain